MAKKETIVKKYQLSNGEVRWQFQMYLGIDKATGKPSKTTRRGFKTQKEAKIEISRLRLEFDKKNTVKNSDLTFFEVYEKWMEGYKNTVRESSFLLTKSLFENWILPAYGHIRIKDINAEIAQRTINKWSKEMKSYKMLNGNAKRIMTFAINNLDIDMTNPFSKVSIPKVEYEEEDEEVHFYSKDEIKRILEYLESIKGRYFTDFNYTLINLLLYSGLRCGEALALTWNDIDFENKTISITKTITRKEEEETGKKVVGIGKPKTKSSIGLVTIDDGTIDILKEWKKFHNEYFKNENNNQIFCKQKEGLVPVETIYSRMKIITKHAQVPFYGVHVFRHTHASLLLEAGASMKDVSDRLRHGSIVMTMDVYSHLTKEKKASTATLFSSFMEN